MMLRPPSNVIRDSWSTSVRVLERAKASDIIKACGDLETDKSTVYATQAFETKWDYYFEESEEKDFEGKPLKLKKPYFTFFIYYRYDPTVVIIDGKLLKMKGEGLIIPPGI